jgi:NAD(P) transhydrogenase subunit alpha
MSADLLVDITIFVLALLVGFEVISKVPATLHTPLMSGANAIHGVVVVGVMLLAASTHTFAGYVVTDRMLEMFKARKDKP